MWISYNTCARSDKAIQTLPPRGGTQESHNNAIAPTLSLLTISLVTTRNIKFKPAEASRPRRGGRDGQ